MSVGSDGLWSLQISNVTASDAGHYQCRIDDTVPIQAQIYLLYIQGNQLLECTNQKQGFGHKGQVICCHVAAVGWGDTLVRVTHLTSGGTTWMTGGTKTFLEPKIACFLQL